MRNEFVTYQRAEWAVLTVARVYSALWAVRCPLSSFSRLVFRRSSAACCWRFGPGICRRGIKHASAGAGWRGGWFSVFRQHIKPSQGDQLSWIFNFFLEASFAPYVYRYLTKCSFSWPVLLTLSQFFKSDLIPLTNWLSESHQLYLRAEISFCFHKM